MAEKQVRNPEGKGGFQDHPELINKDGRPPKEQTFSYWMNMFKNMPTEQFLAWPDNHPESERTVAADLAYTRVRNARKELLEFREVADRTEGKAPQTVIHEGDFFTTDKLKIQIVDGNTNDTDEPEAKNNP